MPFLSKCAPHLPHQQRLLWEISELSSHHDADHQCCRQWHHHVFQEVLAADSLPQTGHRVLQGPPVYDAVSGTSEDVLIVQLTTDSPAEDTAEMTSAAVSGGPLTAAQAMKLAWKGYASGPEIPETAAKIVLDVLLNVMDVKTVWKCHSPGAEAAGFQQRTVEMDHVEAKKTSWLTILVHLTRAVEASVVPR